MKYRDQLIRGVYGVFEVLLLGPLEVRANGALIPLGTRKQQIVFAMLAVHSGRVVTLDELDLLSYPAESRRARQARVDADLRTAARLMAAAESRWCDPMVAEVSSGPVLLHAAH